MNIFCPCASKKYYKDCCALYIQQSHIPETAQQLMRSRYSANVMSNLEYLLSSWHHSSRPTDLIVSDLQQNNWKQLYIVNSTLGQKQHQKGSVEFVAYFNSHNAIEKLHEVSQFVKFQGRWFYVDGKIINNSHYLPGRNSPCYCGSGRKFKHCCLIN